MSVGWSAVYDCDSSYKAMETTQSLHTVVPTKSDSDVILILQLLSKILTCALHLSWSLVY